MTAPAPPCLFTRQHYEALRQFLLTQMLPGLGIDNILVSGREIADFLKADNPNFNRRLFLGAED